MASNSEINHWLQGSSKQIRIECVEIIHPSFTKPYRFTRNAMSGVRAKDESGVWRDYEYLPLSITASRAASDLEQGFTIAIGDVGEIMSIEIDRLRNGQYPHLLPVVNYRAYLSDDLTTPSFSVLGLEVKDNQPNKHGAVFVCKARELNKSATGIVYTLVNNPGLKGYT